MEVLKPTKPLLTTLERALDEIDEHWRNYEGLLIPGSWPGEDDAQFISFAAPKILAAKKNRIPFLGLCLGMQALGIAERGVLEKLDETRRGIYDVDGRPESHWHQYKVEGSFPEYFVLRAPKDNVIEEMHLLNHPFFVGVQYHPEYQSSRGAPHFLLTHFIESCKKFTADGRHH